MSTITGVDLYQAKEKILSLGTKGRVVLKGNNPILLTTTMVVPGELNEKELNERLAYDWGNKNNYFSHSYTDAFIYMLHENLGVHGIIDYSNLSDTPISIGRQSHFIRPDERQIQEYIQQEKIDAMIHLFIGGTIANDLAYIHESNSSFSFMGLSGFGTHLEKMLDDASIANHCGFGGGLSISDMRKAQYSFTDDTILYNTFTNLGILRGKPLERKNLLPRSMQLGICAKDETLSKFCQVGEVFQSYLEWVEQELKEKGPYQAMNPMNPKEKVKK